MFASISGVDVRAYSITVPIYGIWSGDVMTSVEDAVPDQAALTIGDMTLTCHVYRQALFSGYRRLRLVGGYGGWRKVIQARHYQSKSGVQSDVVLSDAASDAGEKINVTNGQSVGEDFVRQNAVASQVLRQIAGPVWHMDPKGVVQTAAWPTVKVTSDFTIVDQFGDEGRVTVATEDYAAFLPGATFTSPTVDGQLTCQGVTYRLTEDGVARLEVMT